MRTFLVAFFLGLVATPFTSGAHAQTKETEKGAKGPISKEEMVSHFKAGKVVEGYVIRGSDVIDIIKNTDLTISIKNSIIEGGLDFRKLPPTPLEKTDLPENWSEKEREKWIKRLQGLGVKKIYVVKNVIGINDTEIRPTQKSCGAGFVFQVKSFAVCAATTLFGDASFNGATFSGDATFYGATFSGDASFNRATFSGEAGFVRATFSGGAGFGEATFSGEAGFVRATFSGGAGFGEATFSGGAGFGEATFSGGAGFYGATFSGGAGFDGATFSELVNLNATFSGKASFNEATFSGGAFFARATFSKLASFDRATFSGRGAFFNGATFSGEASFDGATFSGDASFNRATFSGEASFDGATFSGDASFNRATFSGEAGFVRATFSGEAGFDGATFNGEAEFASATFSRGASFPRATFSRGASFPRATFSERASFRGATFSGYADFRLATFNGEADFSEAAFDRLAYFKSTRFFDVLALRFGVFKAYVDLRDTEIRKLDFNNALSPAIIDGRFDFRKAKISEAHFQDITFVRDVDFSDAKFGVVVEKREERERGKSEGKPGGQPPIKDSPQKDTSFATIFRLVNFDANAYFFRTVFSGKTSLEQVNFKQEANFTDAAFKHSEESGKPIFSLSYVNSANLRISWDQLPHPSLWVADSKDKIESFVDRKEKGKEDTLEPLSHVMKSLEANFRGQNQLGDANEAYYYMKLAELNEARESKTLWQRLPIEAVWIFWGLLSGYGTNIWRVLGWSLLVSLVFSLIYTAKGDLNRMSPTGGPIGKHDPTFRLRLFDLPREYLTHIPVSGIRSEAFKKLLNAWRFSFVVLFKIGRRDTTVSGKIGRVDMKYAVALEWVIGVALLAALVVTLANTQPLINRLITGVF